MFFDLTPVLVGAVQCCYSKLCPGMGTGPTQCSKEECVWEWTPANATADCTTTTCQYSWDVVSRSWIRLSDCTAPCYCPAAPASPIDPDAPVNSASFPCSPSSEDCASLTCRYFWDGTSWGFSPGSIAVNNCKSCTCPAPPPKPDTPEAQYSPAFTCVNTPDLGSWKLTKSCATSCCTCSQENAPPIPANPTIKQKKTYSCNYKCTCGTCSWIWEPYSCTSRCQYIWNAQKGSFSKGYDNCGGKCKCPDPSTYKQKPTCGSCLYKFSKGKWGYIDGACSSCGIIWECPDPPTFPATEGRLLRLSCVTDGTYTIPCELKDPIYSGTWKSVSTCVSPCKCSILDPSDPPADTSKSTAVSGSCIKCDCSPCLCSYTWSPSSESWSSTLTCEGGCKCSIDLPTKNPSDTKKKEVVSGICLAPTTTTTTSTTTSTTPPLGPCSSNTCEYTWIPNNTTNGSWAKTKTCPNNCYCSNLNPPPPTDTTKQITITFPCSSTLNCGKCSSKPCEWECVFDETTNLQSWVLKNSNGCQTCLPPADLCQLGQLDKIGKKDCGQCLETYQLKLCEWECVFNEALNVSEWVLKNSNGCATCLPPTGLCKADKNLGEISCGTCFTTTPPPPPPFCSGSCILNCRSGIVESFDETQNCKPPCFCNGDYFGPNGSFRTNQMICQAIVNGSVNVNCITSSGSLVTTIIDGAPTPTYFNIKNKKIFL